MTVDRRQSPDRREERPGGRRHSDPPEHGTRATYQRGCDCTPCRAANASYASSLRKLKAQGRTPLRSVISPSEAIQRMRALKAEKFSGRAVGRASGLLDHSFVVHPSGITVRKLLMIRRICRLHLSENCDPAQTNETNHASAEGA